jgi:Rad3-related DNA helicase
MERRAEDTVRDLFDHNAPRRLAGQFERRQAQVDMAAAVARALDRKRMAVIEAETGLGKSLAYLVPVFLHCSESGSRAVVSTYTRTLQRQLIDREVPRASRVTGTSPSCAVLLGRSNYICKRAVESLMKRRSGTPPDALARVLAARLEDSDGDLESIPGCDALDGAARLSIACPSRDSICKGCRHRDGCFLLAARRRALEADVVFVNHALLFADVSARGSLLGRYGALVADEAHHLPEAATNALTIAVTADSLGVGAEGRWSGEHDELFSYARAMAAMRHPGMSGDIEELWRTFQGALSETRREVDGCFGVIGRSLRAIPEDRWSGSYGRSYAYTEGSPLLYGIDEHAGRLRSLLGDLDRSLERMIAFAGEEESAAEQGPGSGLRSFQESTRAFHDAFDFLVSGADEEYVFCIHADGGKRPVALSASPIDVSPQLGAILEECGEAQILTSATLSIAGDFSYILRTTGTADSPRVETHVYESPFDLKNRRTLLLASFMPPPGADRFVESAADVVRSLSETTGKSQLVLCTSREHVRSLHAILSRDGALEPRVLPQIDGASRNAIAETFRRTAGTILLGLASFWEGVDFPGDLLEIVVIVKMPFMVPFDPIVRARAERLQRAGEDPFQTLFLPDAALKLKQGAGRLIRTGSDRGVVIVLDSRLGDRPYGHIALKSVTGDFIHCDDRERLLSEVVRVFRTTS